MPSVIIKKKEGAPDSRVFRNTAILPVIAGLDIALEGTDDLILVQCTHDQGKTAYFYQQNFEAITKRLKIAISSEEHPFFNFDPSLLDPPETDENGYYIASINGVTPLLRVRTGGTFTSDITFNGGSTLRWAPYTETDEMDAVTARGISLADIGRPDIDCPDYVRIIKYLNRIEFVLDHILSQIKDVPVLNSTDHATTYGFHKQYQAARILWNYLVNNMNMHINVSQQDAEVFIQVVLSHNFGEYNIILSQAPLTISATPVSTLTDTAIRLGEITKITRNTPTAVVNFTANPVVGGSFRAIATDSLTWTITPSSPANPMTPGELISFVLSFDIGGQLSKGICMLFKVTWSVPSEIEDTPTNVSVGRLVYFSTDGNTPASEEE